jgi:PAS domain S-box-containing protein
MTQFITSQTAKRLNPTQRDLIVLSIIAVLILAFALGFDAFDRFTRWYVQQNEPWDLEEILVVIFFLSLGFAVFAYRRWRELVFEIAERKRVEKVLREQTKRLSTLIETVPNPLFYKDFEGKYTGCNQAFEGFTGRSRLDVVGRTMYEMGIPVEVADMHKEKDDELYRNPGSQIYECVAENSVGEPRNVIVYKAALLDCEGQVTGLVGIFVDITDRRRAEFALQESEARFRAFFEQGMDGVVIIDPETTRFIEFNDQACRQLGYSREEFSRVQLHEIETVETAEEIRAHIRKVEREGLDRFETRHRTKQGEIRQVDVMAQSLSVSGHSIYLCIWRDITERKQFDEKILEQERKYRALFEAANDGIFLYGETGFVGCNQRGADMYGIAKEDLTGRHPAELSPERQPDGRLSSEVAAEIITAVLNGEPQSVQWQYKRSDGAVFDAEITLNRVEIGGSVLVQAIVRDITERKRAEDALREAEQSLRTLLDNIPDGIARFDADCRHLFVNPAIAKTFNVSCEHFIGKTISEAGTAENYESHRALESLVKRGFDEGVSNSVILPSTTAKGVRFVDFLHIPEKDESGKVVSVLGISRDITERKRAEEQLKASESMLRSVYRATPIGLTFSVGRVLRSVNESACRLTGYSEQELVGKSARKFYETDEEYGYAGRELYSRILEKGRSSVETRFRRKDGTTIHVILTAAMLRAEDPASGYVVTIQDITERKRAEEDRRILEDRLQRAEKMEALGTLAGGVAHDLNNVLGIVVGYSEMLLDDLEESSPEGYKAAEILKSGQRAAAIIQDLLTLARRGVPSRKVLNLNKILMDCLESPEFEKVCSFHPKVRIKTDFEHDLLNVAGSSIHLEKSFLNLVSNAAEAMSHNGVITIKTRNQYLDKPVLGYDEVKEGDYVVLSVRDEGEGIKSADMKRIFEPFYTKKVMGRSGTGLGLAVVWGTVKDHFGYVNVESEVGRGTVFTLYFPVTREDITSEQTSVSVSEFLGKGESILVVDDVKEQRELAAAMLRKINYKVICVSGGEEAVEYLSGHNVDLVILDMIMDPGMDGLDTYTKILEIHPGQKAIIVSGFAETERVSKAQSMGAGAYVKKPYVLERLALAARKELDRKR